LIPETILIHEQTASLTASWSSVIFNTLERLD
jgi:hypothetical protein